MTAYVVQTPDVRLVAVLVGLARQSGKRYVYPSQKWILEHLRTWQGRAMCVRTLNYHLAALEKSGWFKRQQRHRAGATGMEFHSSLYVLGSRAWAWLKRLQGAPSWPPMRPAPKPAPAPAKRTPAHPPPEFYDALAKLKPRTRR